MERVIQERTALSRTERQAGAVDSAWFHRAYEPLGRRRWDADGRGGEVRLRRHGYKKAVLLAEVLQGRAKRGELVSNIRDRRLKESVRLLGLLPLPDGDKREPELLARYKVLVEYRRYARALRGRCRARTRVPHRDGRPGEPGADGRLPRPDPAGMGDGGDADRRPRRRARSSVTHDGVTVTLPIDAEAQPEVTVQRGDKPLKAIPADGAQGPEGRGADRAPHGAEAVRRRG